jgi:regulator of sigma E protease
MTVILFLIILGLLVFVHELGHFISAKKAGIRVDEFAIGFPPKVIGKRIGETEYSLNLIPFGGYVKIFGEDGDEDADSRGFRTRINADAKMESPFPPAGGNGASNIPPESEFGAPFVKGESAMADETEDFTRRFTSKPRYIQGIVLVSGVLGNIVFAWLLLSINFMAGVPSAAQGRLSSFSP